MGFERYDECFSVNRFKSVNISKNKWPRIESLVIIGNLTVYLKVFQSKFWGYMAIVDS